MLLIGRDREQEELRRLIGVASQGISGSYVLYGEAGMGKSALLEYAAHVVTNLRLIRVAGFEAENEFSYAALHRVLLPMLENLDYLPADQSTALASAMGLSNRGPADVWSVGRAALSLLTEYAAPKGLLCIIDDLQWADPESLQVLAFVARRLRAEGIAMIFGFRASSELPADLAGIPAVEIGGLSEAAALELLCVTVPSALNGHTARRIIAETDGCPLALIELAEELSSEQWVGADPIMQPIPISRRLEDHFRRRVNHLSRDLQMFLLIAATETSGDRALVGKVAAALDCGADTETLAVRERLLLSRPCIEFRHPLIRSAVYAGAQPADRRAVHLALANSIDKAAAPDRRARHLAAIAVGPDTELAADLEGAAERSRDCGGYAAEASLLAQSAKLTEDPVARSRRFLGAAKAALNGGSAQQSEALLARARLGLTDPLLLAESQQVYSSLQGPLIQPAAAARSFLLAARQFRPLDLERARESLVDALDAYVVSQHMTLGTNRGEIASAALANGSTQSQLDLTGLLLNGFATLLVDGHRDAVGRLRYALDQLSEAASGDRLTKWFNLGRIIANEILDDRLYDAWVGRAERAARKSGALLALQQTLLAAAENELRAGRFSGADAYYAEVREITGATAGPVELYSHVNAGLLAWRGEEVGARNAVKLLLDLGGAVGSADAVFMGYYALAILEIGAGRYEEALRAAEYARARQAIGWVSHLLPIVIEAAARTGERAVAELALAELTERADAAATPWSRGLLARSRALLAEPADAGSLFQEAIAHLERTLLVVELAWTRLVYGEWLRRRNRRVDARAQLRMAYDVFDSIGAARFAGRARAELQATGASARRRVVSARNDLTFQELHIARLASEGATNPEIGRELFLSPSTVDYHLKKVFRKLDISSRRQLRRALSTCTRGSDAA